MKVIIEYLTYIGFMVYDDRLTFYTVDRDCRSDGELMTAEEALKAIDELEAELKEWRRKIQEYGHKT